MAEADMRGGDPQMVPYTPAAGNIAAGQVVLLGNLVGVGCGIAHVPITNSTLGAVSIGGGIYDVTMLTNLAPWVTVYWDDANNKVTATSANFATFGVLLTGNTGANTVVRAYHQPLTPRV